MKEQLYLYYIELPGRHGCPEDDLFIGLLTPENEEDFKVRLKAWSEEFAMKNLSARDAKDFKSFLWNTSNGIIIDGSRLPDLNHIIGDECKPIIEVNIDKIKEADLLSTETFSRLSQRRAEARRAEQRKKQDEAAEKRKQRDQRELSMLIKKYPTLAAIILAKTKRPLSQLKK